MTGDLSSITKTLQKGLKLSEPKELQNGIHSSDVGGAWGAAYAIGTPVSALITGVCCSLAIEYFQKFPEDVPRIRGSVIVVVATTIVGLFIAIDLTYLRLVKNQAPPGGFEDVPWQDDAVALVCGICQLICSAYFGYSVYSVATKKKLVVAWYSLLMIVIFLATFFRAIFGLGTDWFDGAALCPKMTFMWLICSLLLDFSIAVTLLAHLRSPISSKVAVGNPYTPATVFPAPMNSSETNYKNRAPILNRFLTTILTTFSLTVTLMLSLLVLILTMHGTEFDPNYPKTTGIFTALRLLTTPTYAVTFLYTLNRRKPMGTARGFSVGANVGLYDAEIGGRINNSNQTGNKNESAQQIKGDLQKIKGNWPVFFPIFPPKKNPNLASRRRQTFRCRLTTELPLALSATSLKLQSEESKKLFLKKIRSLPQKELKLPRNILTCDSHRQPIYCTTRQSSSNNETIEEQLTDNEQPVLVNNLVEQVYTSEGRYQCQI